MLALNLHNIYYHLIFFVYFNDKYIIIFITGTRLYLCFIILNNKYLLEIKVLYELLWALGSKFALNLPILIVIRFTSRLHYYYFKNKMHYYVNIL